MASLYQRFSGKINTSRSFPVPPEASHLLGGQSSEEDGAAGKTPRPLQQEGSRPRFQYQSRSDCEEEDVSAGVVRVRLGWVLGAPPPRPLSCGMAVCPSRLAAVSCGLSALPGGSLRSSSSPEVPGIVRDGARWESSRSRTRPPPRCPRSSPCHRAPCAALRSRGTGLGGSGSARSETPSASSVRLPPRYATRLPTPLLKKIIFILLLFRVLPLNTLLGQKSSPCPSLLAFLSASP